MSSPLETWAEGNREPATGGTAAPTDTVSGRTTVLPRMEQAEAGVRLVQEQRPRYETLAHVGEGGLGVVVSAQDQDIGRRVAIKRIRSDRQSQGAFLRFVQEVRTVGQLDHPNIVPIHDVGKDEQGGYYFVMKYVEGDTLEVILDRLRAGDRATHAAWGWERRMSVFLQILHAVEFAHQRGIVHRDLKPANVMIGTHGEVQLLDWGVAKQLGQAEVSEPGHPGTSDTDPSISVTHTKVGALIGTPRYMSPEQARGEPADERVDTWALSMLLYELLALSHPFEHLGTLDELLEAIRTTAVPGPAAMPLHRAQGPVPADLGWIAADGLKLDRSARYQTVAQLVRRIERRNEGDFPIQCPVTLQKRALSVASRFVDRHPIGALALATGSVITLVGGVGTVVVGSLSVALGALGVAALL